MKKQTYLSLMVLMASSVYCGAGELLKNPSFESDISKYDKSGWDSRGPREITLTKVSEPVMDGKYALLVDGRTGPQWEGVKQVVKLKPGKAYRLAGAVRLGEGEKSGKGAVQLIKTLKDGTNIYQDIFRGTITADAYTNFSEIFSYDEKDVKVTTISVHGFEDRRSFIVDNFSLTEVE